MWFSKSIFAYETTQTTIRQHDVWSYTPVHQVDVKNGMIPQKVFFICCTMEKLKNKCY